MGGERDRMMGGYNYGRIAIIYTCFLLWRMCAIHNSPLSVVGHICIDTPDRERERERDIISKLHKQRYNRYKQRSKNYVRHIFESQSYLFLSHMH